MHAAWVELDYQRLGHMVRARRNELRMTQREAAVAADMADQTWANVERGERVSERTVAAVDGAVRWEPGSAQDVLQGGEPRPLPDTRQPGAVSIDDVLSALDRMEQRINDRITALENEIRERNGA